MPCCVLCPRSQPSSRWLCGQPAVCHFPLAMAAAGGRSRAGRKADGAAVILLRPRHPPKEPGCSGDASLSMKLPRQPTRDLGGASPPARITGATRAAAKCAAAALLASARPGRPETLALHEVPADVPLDDDAMRRVLGATVGFGLHRGNADSAVHCVDACMPAALNAPGAPCMSLPRRLCSRARSCAVGPGLIKGG